MSAKEEIERLEQKVDVLYNVVLYLMKSSGHEHMANHFEDDVIPYMDVVKLEPEFMDELGKN